MSLILQISDFSAGRFKIPTTTFQESDLNDFITKYENQYLVELLGVELFNLFVADLVAGVPVDARFVAIFDAFNDQDDCFLCRSEGMKEMMKAFVYFHYVRDTYTRNTTNGVKQQKAENSISLDAVSGDLTTRFNEGVNSYWCIQRRMCDDSTLYPEFNGVNLEKTLFI